jgi:hypothetical protein
MVQSQRHGRWEKNRVELNDFLTIYRCTVADVPGVWALVLALYYDG